MGEGLPLGSYPPDEPCETARPWLGEHARESGGRCVVHLRVRSLTFSMMCLWLMLSAQVRAAPSDEADIAAIVSRMNGAAAADIRVRGDWALADKIVCEGATKKKVAVIVLCRGLDGFEVKAELLGAGSPTEEALLYHDVDESVANRLIPRAQRDEMRPIVALLRKMKPAVYPEGVLLETLATHDGWALCGYRERASIKRSDTLHQALLRRTSGAWHLVEDATGRVDAGVYGVHMQTRRVLEGER